VPRSFSESSIRQGKCRYRSRESSSWRKKLADLGLDLEEQGDEVWDALEDYIGREFVVSANVIHRRLKFDGVLEITGGNRVRRRDWRK